MMHEKHKGHEAMHAEMMLILMGTLIVAQALLLFWKSRHLRSYQVCQLAIVLFGVVYSTIMYKPKKLSGLTIIAVIATSDL